MHSDPSAYTGSASTATRVARLWRTRDRAVGTKYTAVAGKRFKHGLTVVAFIEKEARVCGHDLSLFVTTLRTCYFGFEIGVVVNVYHKFTRPYN